MRLLDFQITCINNNNNNSKNGCLELHFIAENKEASLFFDFSKSVKVCSERFLRVFIIWDHIQFQICSLFGNVIELVEYLLYCSPLFYNTQNIGAWKFQLFRVNCHIEIQITLPNFIALIPQYWNTCNQGDFLLWLVIIVSKTVSSLMYVKLILSKKEDVIATLWSNGSTRWQVNPREVGAACFLWSLDGNFLYWEILRKLLTVQGDEPNIT